MAKPFFPDPVFGWVFYLVLVGITAVAAVIDLRRMVVPKWLSLPTLVLGVAFNLVRCGWLGYDGYNAWALEGGNAWIGLIDGLLFSLAGFLTAFTMFFILWILGTCGGGDVKLCAALGAWVGWKYVVMVVIGTLGAVVLISVVLLGVSFVTKGWSKTQRDYSLRKGKEVKGKTLTPRKRLLTFSLPVALATAVVMMWLFRFELQIVSRKADTESGAHAHARKVVS